MSAKKRLRPRAATMWMHEDEWRALDAICERYKATRADALRSLVVSFFSTYIEGQVAK